MQKMRGLVGDENSEKRLVDGNMDLAYKINCIQMNLDKPWGIFFYLVVICFWLGWGDDLVLINLDVIGSLDHTYMHKQFQPIH